MADTTFRLFGGSDSGAFPKGWTAVTNVYNQIATEFFTQIGTCAIEETRYAKIAGAPPKGHDLHDVKYFLTWQVLNSCKQIGRLEKNGSVTRLEKSEILTPDDEWDSANSHVFLPDGRLGTGVDSLNRHSAKDNLESCGYAGHQLIVVRTSEVTKGRSEVFAEIRGRGRPRIGPQAVKAYRERFPNFHREEGLSNEQAAQEISRQIGLSVSWKTIERALKSTG